MHPCGQHRNAHEHAIRSIDEMHAPSKELLPFGGALPAAFALAHVPTAPGARPAAYRLGEAIDDEHVARGEHLPQHFRNPGHPIGELIQARIEARDADPIRQIAALVLVHDLHGPLVMVAKILGGDDGNRQNLRVGDVRPYITAMSPGVSSTCRSR